MTPYRQLLRDPVLRGLAVADACARLPQGMVSITLLTDFRQISRFMPAWFLFARPRS